MESISREWIKQHNAHNHQSLSFRNTLLFSTCKWLHATVLTHMQSSYTLNHLQPSLGVRLSLLTDISGKEIPLWSRDFPITGELMKHSRAVACKRRSLIPPHSPGLEKICTTQYGRVNPNPNVTMHLILQHYNMPKGKPSKPAKEVQTRDAPK